ncbi:MAG: class I SAM-dependent methyltransferase [Spirochaetes bacterium]|nr:class I SAM-dependent methyltransferase [Spirochaetota bacterium]
MNSGVPIDQSAIQGSGGEASPMEDFWSGISVVYMEGTGHGFYMGERAAKMIFGTGIAAAGSMVLDVGSGPGTMAVPLAARGCMVTALDSAPGMCDLLDREASRLGGNLRVLRGRFEEMEAGEYDLVLAGFCPAVQTVEALRRMERLSHRHCAVLMAMPSLIDEVREHVWRMGTGRRPPRSITVPDMLGMLEAMGKAPRFERASVEVVIERPVETLGRFYDGILAAQGHAGASSGEAIGEVIGGRLRESSSLRFEKVLTLLHWVR